MVINTLNALINDALSLRGQIEYSLNNNTVNNNLISEGLVRFVVPHGFKGFTRKVGGGAYKLACRQKEAELRSRAGFFLQQCESALSKISINKKDLDHSGNSKVLIRKFNRAKRIKHPVKFLDAVISVLNEIKTYDLIWNKDISSVLEDMKRPLLKQKASQTDLWNVAGSVESLERYPGIQKQILGAFERLKSKDIESNRHCINSCRVAIENLCVKLGGHSNWKISLKDIYPSDMDVKVVKNVWNYLSSRGMHAGHEPTYEDAEYCLKLTLTALSKLMSVGKAS